MIKDKTKRCMSILTRAMRRSLLGTALLLVITAANGSLLLKSQDLRAIAAGRVKFGDSSSTANGIKTAINSAAIDAIGARPYLDAGISG
jgi:hypothetical protein